MNRKVRRRSYVQSRFARNVVGVTRDTTLIKIITPILTIVVLGTIAVLLQEKLTPLFRHETKLFCKLVSFNSGVFNTSNNKEIIQINNYNIYANDYVADIEIEIICDNNIYLKNYGIQYSINTVGDSLIYRTDHSLKTKLKNHLDETRKVQLSLNLSYHVFSQSDSIIINYQPNINIKGKDNKGNIVYRVVN